MFLNHEYFPTQFDHFISYQKEPFGMPKEHVFSLSVNYLYKNKEHCWKRVWYLSDLELKQMKLDINALTEEEIRYLAKDKIHPFKKDISDYLVDKDYALTVSNEQLKLIEK